MRKTLSDLNQMERSEFVATVGPIFEHSPWIAKAVWEARPFASIEVLHTSMCEVVRSASLEEQLSLITAHPDLAGKLAKTGQLTQESTSEQEAAGLGTLTSAELELFDQRNRTYRDKFGFPFIICARLSNKQGILDAFEFRLNNSRDTEMKTALEEIYKIARLRLEALE